MSGMGDGNTPHTPTAAIDERLLRAVGAADRASTSMTPYGPMNDKWLTAFKETLAAEGLAVRDAPVETPDSFVVGLAADLRVLGGFIDRVDQLDIRPMDEVGGALQALVNVQHGLRVLVGERFPT